ncbi:MAG: hypothetical protein Q4B04_01490 [bacterium]|nr:hypothetical protein [bacterium]
MENNVVEAKFVLSKQDVVSVLQLSNDKQRQRKKIINTALLFLATVLFGVCIFENPDQKQNYIFAFACVLLIAFIWIWPVIINKTMIKKALSGRQYHMFINENGLSFTVEGFKEQSVLKGDIVSFKEDETAFIIELCFDKILIIPKRVLDKEKIKLIAEYLRCNNEQ